VVLVVAEFCQLLIEGLVGGLPLFENFLDQVLPARFELLLFGKEFVDVNRA
jgi:hypothetical protein